MIFNRLLFAPTLLAMTVCLATTAQAQPITDCTKDQGVLTPEGARATVVGGPVAGTMCMVRTADGNVAPIQIDQLTVDAAEPLPVDVRSIVPGAYGCQALGANSDTIVLTIDILDDSRYAITGEGEGTWKAYDALSIQFLDGPLGGRFSTAQISTIFVSRSNDGPQLLCKVRS